MAGRQLHQLTVGTFVALLESIPDGVVVVDADGSIVLVNGRFEDLFGYVREQLVGQPIEMLVPTRFHERYRELRAAYLAKPAPAQVAEQLEPMGRRSDGSELPIDITLQPIDAHPPLIAVFVRDASAERARRQRESDLATRLLRAEKLETVGQHASAIAHDFNNLLAVILADAETLVSFSDSEVRSRASEIVDSAERAARLTQQLLRSSPPVSNRPEVLDLGQTVQSLDWILRRVIGAGHHLTVEIAPDLGHVLADPNQIAQLLVNLVINARDAMADGGRTVVKVSAASDDPAAISLSVSDTGSGMDSDVAEQAFEPFFTTKEPKRGTGLGLFSVAEIAEQNGGRIELTSEPGRGTTFTVSFPVVAAVAPGATLEQPTVHGASSA